MNTPDAIDCQGLFFSYPDQSPLFENFSFRIPRASFYGIIGPNGSGKSTLARLLTGYLKADSGRIKILDQDNLPPSKRAGLISLVPQENHIVFPYTVEELVLMGRTPHLGTTFFEQERDLDVADRVIFRMGLDPFRHKPVQQLSGGERRRCMLAMAMAQEPEILIMDEPSSFLDLKYQIEIFEALQELHQQGLTIIVISHDLNLSGQYCQKLLLLKNARIKAEGTPKEVITSKILKEAYETEFFLDRMKQSGLPFVLPLRKKH